MPLVDAYMNYTGGIEGSYKSVAGPSGVPADTRHDGWSEVYEFKYALDDGVPSISITKPADKASNLLYYRYLQCRFKDAVAKSDVKDRTIEEINLELCRWVDTDRDGVVDKFIAFVKYQFKGCRILNYGIAHKSGGDDEFPVEEIVLGFKEMYMTYYRPKDPSSFGWDFRTNKTATTR
jgi:type VI protein secretion system component Hcp